MTKIHPDRIRDELVNLLVHNLLNDPHVISRARDAEDELLTLEHQARLLKISKRQLEKEIEAGFWRVYLGPGNKKVITRKQFREQRDSYLTRLKRGY